MENLSDIEIAQNKKLLHIREIAAKLGVDEDDLEMYGKHKAKLPLTLIDEDKIKNNNLILVTATTPNKSGSGKTTLMTSVMSARKKNGIYA